MENLREKVIFFAFRYWSLDVLEILWLNSQSSITQTKIVVSSNFESIVSLIVLIDVSRAYYLTGVNIHPILFLNLGNRICHKFILVFIWDLRVFWNSNQITQIDMSIMCSQLQQSLRQILNINCNFQRKVKWHHYAFLGVSFNWI